MKKKCICGYIMSDTIIPNHTSLRLYLNDLKIINTENPGEEYTLIFHCECCHRLHFFPSKYSEKSLMLRLNEKYPQQSLNKTMKVHIKNDYDVSFEGLIDLELNNLCINYHGKEILYSLEKGEDSGLCLTSSIANVSLPYEDNKSVSSSKTRCVCGWLINKELSDDKSIICLYSLENLEQRVKYEFGEENIFLPNYGICCEKCNRILLPNKNGVYDTYSLTESSECKNKDYSFLYYSIRLIDEYILNFDDADNLVQSLNKILISSDKQFLEVHNNSNVSYYSLE